MNKQLLWLGCLALILIVTMTACQSTASQPTISVEEAWGPPSPASAVSGAFYMVIHNRGPADRIVSVLSEACGTAEIHQSSMSENEVMSMHRMSSSLVIPAKEKVELKPGGLHIMCIEKKVDFTAGSKLSLTLIFEKNGPKTVQVEIREP